MTKEELLKDLNPQQREAVEINSGSLLVFAGAGSGKTRVITTKIAYAVEQGLVKPWQILAVTFTNKACREMQERVAQMVEPELAQQVMIRTFHSFGVWLLRRCGERVGLAKNFTIYNDRESAALLQQCFPEEPKKEVEQAARRIAALKDTMRRVPDYDEKLKRFYRAYQEKLEATGNLDFADMILKSTELLHNDAEVRQKIRDRFKMILVDEYQDSNTAQYLLLQELAGPDTFLCVVGDDDQSIYRFRGARVENILNFSKTFQNTRTVVLGRNYRCTAPILEAAKDIIKNNSSRAEKNLTAEKSAGEKPKVYYVNSELDEAEQVVRIIKNGLRSEWESTAVLYRTNAQSKAFEDRFIMNGIPYHIVGSLRFYDREEIRDCIAVISLLANPRDSVAFERMVNKPARGIGNATVSAIIAASDSGPWRGDLLQTAQALLSEGSVKGRAAGGLQTFLEAYNSCAGEIGNIDNSTLLYNILSRFGIMDHYINRDKEEHSVEGGRVENLNQLVNTLTAEEFSSGIEGIHAFLEYAALDPASLGETEGAVLNGVTLITMHNTKGLEFDRVFVTGMEDELFPGLRYDSTEEDLEEERRICYVAFTRARKELYILSAGKRMVWGRFSVQHPSRFLSEIDPSHIEEHNLRTERRGFGFFPDGGAYTSFRNPDQIRTGLGGYRSRYSSDAVSGKLLKPRPDTYEDWQPKPVLIKKGASPAAAKPPINWKEGDRVMSEVLGKGTITKLKKFGEKDVLVVDFDNGKMGTFAAALANFTKLEQ